MTRLEWKNYVLSGGRIEFVGRMNFQLDYIPLASNRVLTGLANAGMYLYPHISEAPQFRKVCAGLIDLWADSKVAEFSFASEQFKYFMNQIEVGGDNVVRTPCGGLVIKAREDPYVARHLLVRGAKFMDFERHSLKEEHITVREGCGFVLHRQGNMPSVRVVPLEPGVSIDFAPGEEHCVAAFSDLLIFEESKDYKGMDQDIQIIFSAL